MVYVEGVFTISPLLSSFYFWGFWIFKIWLYPNKWFFSVLSNLHNVDFIYLVIALICHRWHMSLLISSLFQKWQKTQEKRCALRHLAALRQSWNSNSCPSKTIANVCFWCMTLYYWTLSPCSWNTFEHTEKNACLSRVLRSHWANFSFSD